MCTQLLKNARTERNDTIVKKLGGEGFLVLFGYLESIDELFENVLRIFVLSVG